MKLSFVTLVFFLFVVQCTSGFRPKTQNLQSQNNTESAADRPSRESRKFLRYDSYGNRQEEFEAHKQRANQFKSRRRSKSTTTTPAYDYADYDENSSKEIKSGYEDYYKRPYGGDVGKIFNQKDINDYFLKGNGDYAKLVKDVALENQRAPYFEDDTLSKFKEESNYKTIVSYDKKDSASPSYNFASKDTPTSSYSYETKDGSVSSFKTKNKEKPYSSSFKYGDQETPVSSYSYGKDVSSPSFGSNIKETPVVTSTSYGNKDVSFSSFNYENKKNPASSFSYENKDPSFSSFNYENKKNPASSFSYENKDPSISNYNYNKNSPISNNEYGNKDALIPNFSYGKDSSISSYSYGNKDNYANFVSSASDTMTNNGWSALIPKYTTTSTTTTTISPFDYRKLYGKGAPSIKDTESPFKTYASDFNFDTKNLPNNQPTKYTVPYGKYSLKNTEYVSEFDAKGNPITSSSEVSSEYMPEKDYSLDFTKSFYNYNSAKKPAKLENFYDYNSKKPSDQSYEWDWGSKSYAANYDYFGKGLQSEFAQRYPEFSKYAIPSSYKDGKYGSVEVPQPIIVPVPQPYPVKVPIAKPVAVPIVKEIKVPIEKVVPYPVIKNVPYPVEKHVPVPVEKKVPVPVPQLYPVKIPIIKNIYHHAEDHHEEEHEEHMPKRPTPNRQRGRGRPRERPGKKDRRQHPNRHHQNRFHQGKHRDQFDEQDEIHEQYEEYYHEEPFHRRGHHHRYDRFHDRRRHT